LENRPAITQELKIGTRTIANTEKPYDVI
jgi:hypothetical protein